jgi:predicted phosphodiesterase
MLRKRFSHVDHEELHGLAASWRTQVQLGRLSSGPRAGSEPFNFAVLGDVEPSRFRVFRYLFNRPDVFSRQMAAIKGHPVDFCLQLGDMVSTGTPSYYLDFFRQIGGFGIEKPYLTVIGNHDRSRPNGRSHSTMYRRLFGKANYFFEHGGARFVVLDTSAKRLTKAQLKWLRLVLDTPLRKIVFTHMPPVLLGLWGGTFMQGIGGFSRNAAHFAALVSEMGVERVYMGHVHAFGVQDYRGVRYVLTGGGGSALFPSGSADVFHHYLTVSVGPQGIRERVHPLDGQPFEIPSGKVLIQSRGVAEPFSALLGYT